MDACMQDHKNVFGGGVCGAMLGLYLSLLEAMSFFDDHGGVYMQGDSYDYDTNTCAEGKDCATYLQIVWKNSTKIGCGEVRNV